MTSRRLHHRILRTWALCAWGLCLLVLPARAATIAWKTGVSGSWNIATNWFPAQVPGAGDVAVITTAGTYDVNMNGSVSVNAINLGSNARLKVNNVTLTMTTGIAVGSSATLELNSGTLSGGSVALNGQLSSTGTSNVNAALTTATTSTITVGGTLTVANGFTNQGLLSFSATGTPTLNVTSGTLTNAATGTISCATTGNLVTALDNQGSVAVTSAQGLLSLYKPTAVVTHNNSGSMSVSGGGLLLLDIGGDTFNTSGSLSADALSILRVSGGDFHQTDGTISGTGYFELVTTHSATFASNPTVSNLYLAGDGIVFPSALVNGAAQKITLGFAGDVTAPQLTNQAGYELVVHEGVDALHATFFFNLGTLQVPRSFNLDGSLNCGPLSAIAFELGGTNPGEFDQFVITGAAQLAGAVFFNLENGFVPNVGDYFDVLTTVARVGMFHSSNGWDIGNDLYLATDPIVTSSDSQPYRIRTVRQTWVPLNPSGPPPAPRREHSAVFASSSNRMVVFGGEDGSGTVMNDTWVLRAATDVDGNPAWIPLSPLGVPPSPRKGHSAVYDGSENRMIVFGGENDSSAFFNDTWILTHADGRGGTPEWIQLPQIPAPGGRSGHAAGYDPINKRMVVSGGGVWCSPAYGDMHVLDHANGIGSPTWSIWTASGVPPSGRRDATVAWDPQGSRLFVVGGRFPCSTTVFGDSFVLLNAGGAPGAGPYWGPLGAGASPALPSRAGSKGAYDTLFDRFLSFGGLEADGITPSPAVLLMTGTKGSSAGWTELPVPVTAPRPSARAFHSLVYEQAAHRGVVFGGDSSGVVQNDVWILELEVDLAKVTGIDQDADEPRNNRGVLRFSTSPSPNPASHGVEFSIQASQTVPAEVRVYDALGRRVTTLFDGPLTEGEHRFNWKGNVASGIYFVAVQSGKDREIRRIVIAH